MVKMTLERSQRYLELRAKQFARTETLSFLPDDGNNRQSAWGYLPVLRFLGIVHFGHKWQDTEHFLQFLETMVLAIL